MHLTHLMGFQMVTRKQMCCGVKKRKQIPAAAFVNIGYNLNADAERFFSEEAPNTTFYQFYGSSSQDGSSNRFHYVNELTKIDLSSHMLCADHKA